MKNEWVILFDIGGVILEEEVAYKRYLDEVVYPCLKEAFPSLNQSEFGNIVRDSIMSFVPGLISSIVWRLCALDQEKFRELKNSIAQRTKELEESVERILVDGIKGLMREISGEYTLSLAGNAKGSIREVLMNYGLLEYFEHTLVSEDLCVSKPDTRFFMHYLDVFKIAPSRCIMIGDRLDNDIIPAKRLGLRTIWFRRGMYSILSPRNPGEIPDQTVSNSIELRNAIKKITEEEVSA
ncbi:MAG: HAD family hydrolase [Opitutaceae bacterium]|nr:HAD family hydrolase [Opitutaceae bacterium]